MNTDVSCALKEKEKMKLFLIVLMTFLLATINAFAQQKAFVPKKIVFEKTMIFEAPEPSKNLNQLTPKDSLFNPNNKPRILGGLDGKQKMMILELKEDSLWKYETWNNKIVSAYSLIREDGKILTFFDNERLLVKWTFDNFQSMGSGKISIDKKNVKSILGLKCYQVTIEAPMIRQGQDTSTFIYEMFVTDLVKVPIFSIINVNRNYPFFPLELKAYLKDMPDLSEQFKAISIEK